MPEPIYSSGVQRSTRINYLPSSQSCAPFQSHADCDKSPNSKGGESYDWNYGWNSCCSGFCPSNANVPAHPYLTIHNQTEHMIHP